MFTTKFHLKEHELHSGYVAMTSNLKRVQHNKMTYPVNHGLTDSSRQSWDNRINTRDSHGATERLILTIMGCQTHPDIHGVAHWLTLTIMGWQTDRYDNHGVTNWSLQLDYRLILTIMEWQWLILTIIKCKPKAMTSPRSHFKLHWSFRITSWTQHKKRKIPSLINCLG